MSNKLYEENDIQNIANAIRNKNGTEDTYKVSQMPTAIDSIEVIEQATAEGESISLANTKAMPYSDYVVEGKSEQDGEPSPSIPSEIHSVADDDINIFNAEKIENYNIKVKDNGKTIIMPVVTSGNGNTNTATKLNVLCPDLQVGDVIYIRFKRNLNNNRNKFIYLYGSNKIMYASENSPSYTITQEDLNSYVFLYGNDYDYGETEQCIITDFKIQKNTVPINYSPYNQGTVTIKQRGKNKFNKNDVETGKYINSSGEIAAYQDYSLSNYIEIKPSTRYCYQGVSGWSERSAYYDKNKNLISVFTLSALEQWQYFDTPNNCYYVRLTVLNSDLNNYQLEEGTTKTTYEPYQGYDKVFQTEPLRSLPNGVKDTIEAEQHRKIGRQTGTLTETTTITLSDAKTNGAYMCNIKPSGTLTGKTIELEAGDYEIIYELETEIIEPLTQNQATTMLDIIKTGSYEGTTNIYTDEDVKPTMKVGHYKKG